MRSTVVTVLVLTVLSVANAHSGDVSRVSDDAQVAVKLWRAESDEVESSSSLDEFGDGVTLITFDFYAALVDTGGSIRRNVQELLKGRYSSSTIASLTSAWIGGYSMLKDVNGLSRNEDVQWAWEDKFYGMQLTTLRHAAKSTKVTLSRDDEEKLIDTWTRLTPHPGTVDALVKLRNAKNRDGERRFKLGVLSNGNESGLREAVKVFLPHFEFDYLLSSTGVGVFKPEPIFYAQVLDHAKSKHSVIHVAGAGFDALGAKVFGLKTVWNNIGLSEDFENIVGNPAYEPDHIISDIKHLPPLLGL